MSRRAFVLIVSAVILAGTSLFLLRGNYPITNEHSSGANIIAFGDSITYGTGAARDEDYPSRLSRMVGTKIINAGVPGDTTELALKRLERDVLRHDPKIVIVLLGGNDILTRVPKSETFRNLDHIITRIQEKGAMVVLVGIQGMLLVGNYKSEFRRLAREKGAVQVPNILSGILDRPKYKSDQIHPNGEGYRIMAERIHRKLRPYLNP